MVVSTRHISGTFLHHTPGWTFLLDTMVVVTGLSDEGMTMGLIALGLRVTFIRSLHPNALFYVIYTTSLAKCRLVSKSWKALINTKDNVNPKMTGAVGIFDLSKLISMQGYDCIVEAIFINIDPTSLAKCRLVSKSWKALIDTRRTILVNS